MLGLRMSVKEALNKLVHCVVRQACPELRRRAHHERNQAVAVHSELFVSTQGRLVEGPDQRMSVKGCETIKAHGMKNLLVITISWIGRGLREVFAQA
jgi:hypothetical protein